jgi:hypothetical protein
MSKNHVFSTNVQPGDKVLSIDSQPGTVTNVSVGTHGEERGQSITEIRLDNGQTRRAHTENVRPQ